MFTTYLRQTEQLLVRTVSLSHMLSLVMPNLHINILLYPHRANSILINKNQMHTDRTGLFTVYSTAEFIDEWVLMVT